MGRKLAAVAALVAVSSILGATVLREPIAYAAEKVTPVFVTNNDANPVPVEQQGTSDVRVTNASVPVQQQGTADVRVTNNSLTVAPQAPITGGGYGIGANAGNSTPVVDNTATAISLTMSPGVTAAVIKWRGDEVAFFYGPAFGGERSVVLALSRPIRIDELECKGTSGSCQLGWVGADS